MLLPIYLYGHPVLRAETEEITPDYPDLKKLIADMWETMYNSEGVGLAAPQMVGWKKTIVSVGKKILSSFFISSYINRSWRTLHSSCNFVVYDNIGLNSMELEISGYISITVETVEEVVDWCSKPGRQSTVLVTLGGCFAGVCVFFLCS